MPDLTIQFPPPDFTVPHGQQLRVAGVATGTGGAEPVLVDSVRISVDGGPPVEADLTVVKHQQKPTVTFVGFVDVPEQPGAHTVRAVAIDDQHQTASRFVSVLRDTTVVVGPPAIVIDLEPPDPAAALAGIDALVGTVQQALLDAAGLLAGSGSILAGPNVIAATDAAGIPILRLGIWLVDPAFPVVPPGPGFALPRLTADQAAAGFATVPPLPRGHRTGFTDTPFGVRVPVTTLQTPVDAAVAEAGNDDVQSVAVSAAEPATVVTSVHGTHDGIGFEVDVTETLSVAPIANAESPQSVPHVDADHSSSVGDLLTWLIGDLIPIFGALLVFGAVELAENADQVPGVVTGLIAGLPARVPLRNTSLPGDGAAQFDFPQVVLDWTAFGVANGGIEGAGDALLTERDPAAARLSIGGPDALRLPAGELDLSLAYRLRLSGVRPDPGALTWTLRRFDGSTDSGTAEPDVFAEGADVDLDFVVPLHSSGIATFVATAAAVETCGTDPSKTISADGAETIRVTVPVPHLA